MGCDYFWEILKRERIVLLSGLLLSSSKFGYILTGKYHDPKDDAKDVVSTYLTATHDACLNVLWSLDSIQISKSPDVKEDDNALEEFDRKFCCNEQ